MWEPGSIHIALTCCAKGKFGTEALQILSLIENRSRFITQSIRLSAGDELRLLLLVVKALTTKEQIVLLPELLKIITKTGAQSSPRLLDHNFFLT